MQSVRVRVIRVIRVMGDLCGTDVVYPLETLGIAGVVALQQTRVKHPTDHLT